MNKFGQNTDQPAVYFNKLYMKNVRCFKGNHEIDLGNGNGEPSQWTVILGNNNVGKTTILRVIASLELIEKVSSNNETSGGYRGGTVLSGKKYLSFGEDLLFIGNELIIKKIHNIDYSPLSEQFRSNIKVNRNNLPFKSFKKEDIDWIDNIKISSNITQSGNVTSYSYPKNMDGLEFIRIMGYGTSRMMIDAQSVQVDNTQGLFDNKTLLLNVEEWLKELHFAANNNNKNAEIRYNQVENILCGGLLPDVTEIRITTIPDKSSFETFPEFLTSQGWVRLEDLGYGYQATLAWVADLARRMFDEYPGLENPLHGPAVVLVDEIDLHLHPEWQRKIIKYLSDLFPNTQFIVTAHSPLIIQSAENVNLIMLEKDDNPDGKGINIRQRFGSFQGWTVDEILTELMNMGDRTRSDLYLQLMEDFENAVLDDDYEKAQNAYNQLDTILSPSSYQRKVLQIQMSSLIPVGV
jgi:energy-coupling factor transporter ATP-binding protein EcfA2